MNINNVVVTGRLVRDAQIVESEHRPGRFDVEFVIALNHKRNATNISEKTTFLTVTMNTTENGATFFSRNLYKGREVLASGGICSRIKLGQGTSDPFIFVEASSIQAIGDERPAGQSMTCGPDGMIESEPAVSEPEPVKAAPRVFAVQRPGAQAPAAPAQAPAPTSHSAPPQYGNSHQQSDAATLYRDKGLNTAQHSSHQEHNLCKW